MSFNRRGGPDRRYDRPDRPDRSARPDRDRYDRPPRREGGDDWQARDRGPGARPGGPRPYQPRPRFDRGADEGGMSIRLDPRRLATLKQLAAESDQRPGDLVRHWVEERIDAARAGVTPEAAPGLAERLAALTDRVAALEAAAAGVDETATASLVPVGPDAERSPRPTEQAAPEAPSDAAPPKPRRSARRVAAAPSERVALHDEMIAVLAERGPMTAAELAAAVVERGRYAPPRSGKPLDAAMVSQRVSNPTYRSRFTRNEGRIGLAEPAE